MFAMFEQTFAAYCKCLSLAFVQLMKPYFAYSFLKSLLTKIMTTINIKIKRASIPPCGAPWSRANGLSATFAAIEKLKFVE